MKAVKKRKITGWSASARHDQHDELDLSLALQRFVETHSAERLGRNLRNLLLEFLMTDGGAEAPYLKELANDLTGLYDLLDAISDRTRDAPQ